MPFLVLLAQARTAPGSHSVCFGVERSAWPGLRSLSAWAVCHCFALWAVVTLWSQSSCALVALRGQRRPSAVSRFFSLS